MTFRTAFLLCFFAPMLSYSQTPNRPAQETLSPLERLLKQFPESDTNKDGVLSQEEVKNFREQQAARRREFLRRFPEMDTNKDGTFSLEEIRRFQSARRGTEEQPMRNRPRRSAAPFPNVAYGEHRLQCFDLWPVPDAKEPTPLVIFIHGGGFRSGDKAMFPPGIVETYHKAGVAFAAMNYRLSNTGPYPMMMHDAARGLQTIRHRAKEWNLDPERVACYGGSAGAGISLWLAFHEDLADPDSDDPIARQSTRILAAGSTNGQSTYDLHTFREWFELPDLAMGPALPAFYDLENESDVDRPEIKALMKDASPITHLSKDDRASVYMLYSRPNVEVTLDTSSAIWVHHVLLGLKLQEAMQDHGLECVVTAPDLPADANPYQSLEDFLITKLTE
ncbi:Acetyl esterase/lipase [Planctomycetales bacterium 10988]|nr:Acetyl esterase/lipase [Planctomycetales bacterium 10988]